MRRPINARLSDGYRSAVAVIAEVSRGFTWSPAGATALDVIDDPIDLPPGVVLSRRRETVASIVQADTGDFAAYRREPGMERAFLVDSTIQLDGPAAEEGPIMFVFFGRRRDLSIGEFRAHWHDVHAPLALRHHIGMSRYVQHVVVEAADESVDGIAELHFPSVRDLSDRFYDSDEGVRAIATDVARFTGRRADTYLVRRRHH